MEEVIMQCINCGSKTLQKIEVERYEYVESGLCGVFLKGVTVHVCKKCGEEELAIPAIERLHTAIASALASKPQRLQPTEVRFLRKHLGLSGRDFAALLRVTPETVSRWENPKRESEYIGETSELLLRTLIMSHQKPITDYNDFGAWGKAARASLRAVFRRTKDAWASERAA
jgi:putative zinc finger/helix-turn-helix YgiT family protein